VAVVGLSGGGSQVATQLGALGVGEIIGIDAQRVASDNLVATHEFGCADALLLRRKTAALKSKLWWINGTVRFTAVNALVLSPPNFPHSEETAQVLRWFLVLFQQLRS